MDSQQQQLFNKWQSSTSFMALLLYIAYAGTRRLNLPVEVTYFLLGLAVLYFFFVLYLLFYTVRYRLTPGTAQKTYSLLGFRLLISLVLLYLVAGSIWAF